jgi:hypothetical protein
MGEEEWRWDERCLQISRAIFNMPDGIPEAHWRTITCDYQLGKDRLEEYKEWKMIIQENGQIRSRNWDSAVISTLTTFGDNVSLSCTGRKFFSTASGSIGLGPMNVQPGDRICIPFQSDNPLIMRKYNENGRYKILGQAYCYGLMYGEVFKLAEEGKAKEIRFAID